MISLRSIAFCGAAALGVGCAKEASFTQPIPDYAEIHWVNAVPDTGLQDIRLVDIVSNAALYDVSFRGSNMFYQPIESGTHTVRVFTSGSTPPVSGNVMAETTLNLTTGSGYTFIHAGFARTGSTPARQVMIVPDAPPSPVGDSVSVRFIQVAAGLGNLDLNIVRRGSDTLPDVPLRANVAYGTVTAYTTLKSDSIRVFHPRLGADSVVFYDTLRVVATAAGTKTPRLFTTNLPLGQVNTINTGTAEPIAGAALRGSVMNAVITPRSVAGSQAPQTAAFTTPAAVILVERRPAKLSPAP